MSFAHIQFFETEEDERARLQQFPAGSTYEILSALPVTNEHVKEGQVLELPAQVHGEGRVLVTVLERTGQRTSADGNHFPLCHDGTYIVRVLASTNPAHTTRTEQGYDLSCCEAELRRSRVLSPKQLLSTPTEGER